MNRIAVYGIIAIIIIAAGGYAYYRYAYFGTVDVYVTTGNADPLYVTTSSIMLHSTSGQWITVSNKTTTVLLGGNLSFLASSTVPAGNYTELRLVVSSATVEIAGFNVSVTVPSGVFKVPIIAGGLHVSGGAASRLEIIIGPHLVSTGNGQYIISPVITAKQI
ncbi:MAG: DUF4382 domain-containing protein [Nitrososphaerota archaeon]|jgi:hypothetical protein|nr:DUF4382 domain-containing protein [Nitrososphaerota archaeon]